MKALHLVENLVPVKVAKLVYLKVVSLVGSLDLNLEDLTENT